ncbi:uncharacterized protein LOC143046563 [Mytilus galloprovincialis]|uniref:uncharacterized protein LOC143046563 n=1 Tax=Mytilus galloprovincialis TaxID=29158 RepID=UPI003F7C700D
MEVGKRKPNWSESELLALSATVNANINVIRGQFGPSLTVHDKTKTWAQVAERKWKDVKSVTKKKEATRVTASRVTGGGPPQTMEGSENTLLAMNQYVFLMNGIVPFGTVMQKIPGR